MNCPVCFGGEDAAMRESLNAGIGVLMGVTVIVLACFARFVFRLVRRANLEPGISFHEPSPVTPDPLSDVK
jgi:hypothetical protein